MGYDVTQDNNLVIGLRSGDEKAYKLLYKQHYTFSF